MKKFIVLLPFGLLGGLLTFLGGLTGKVEFSVLLIRSLFAVLICVIILFGLLLFLSRTLFQGTDLFSHTVRSPPYPGGRKQKNRTEPQQGSPDENEHSKEDYLLAASSWHGDSSTLNTDDLADKIAQEARVNENINTTEEQFRSADSKELANLVRYSMNEE